MITTLLLLSAAVHDAQAESVPVPLVGEEIVVTDVPISPNKPSLQINIVPYDLNTMMFTFPSGLRVMFQEDDTLPVVAITTVYDHGASEDPEGKFGLAHLMEHMWFRTEHGDLPSTWQLLDTDLGCNLNAFTQYDITAYMSVCPSWQLDTLLRLESLRMAAPLEGVTEEMIKTEEEVVRNEIRMRTENGNIPFFPILEYVNKLTYPEDHPYHRPMAGDHTTIRNISLQDVKDWIEPRYVPDSTTIMVVGDFEHASPQDLITKVLKNFDLTLLHPDLTPEHLVRFPKDGIEEPDPDNEDDWWLAAKNPENEDEPISASVEIEPRSKKYANTVPVEPQHKDLQVYESTVDDPTVIVTWSLPPGYQGNDTLMQLTGGVLSSVIAGNPFFGELDDPNIDEFGGCGALPDKWTTTLVCSATVKDPDKRPDQVAEAMINQLYLMKNPDYKKFLKAEFSYVRNQILADIFRSMDLFAAVGAGRATEIATFAHFTGSPEYHSSKMNEAMSIEIEAVSGLIEEYITRDRASMAIIKPIDREDVLEVSGDGSDHYNVSNQGTNEKFVVDTSRLTEDAVMEVFRGPDFESMKEYNFSNGLRVVIAPHGEAPVARAILVVNGGSAQDLDGNGYIRHDYTTYEWPEDPLQIAGVAGFSWEDGHEALQMEASAGNVDGMLWMMRNAVDTMRVDFSGGGGTPSLSERSKKGKDRVVANFGKMDWHMQDMVNEHLNPGHPATSAVTIQDYKDLKKLKRGDMQALLEQKWQPSNATLILVGNLDHEEALEMARTYFGGWRPEAGVGEYKLPDVPAPNPAGPSKVLVFDDPGKTQTLVELNCPAEYVGNAPSPAHRVLGVVLSNELSTILRETAGVVYSPYAYSYSGLDGDARTTFGARVQNSAAAFTVQTYWDLIKLIENGEFSKDQITQEKYSTALKYVLNQQSVAQLSQRLEYTVGYQRGWDYFDAYGHELASLGISDLQEAMGSCSEHAIVTLKGPKDEIAPLLDEEGITYEVVDWKQRGYDLHKAQDPKGYKKAEKKRLKAEKKAAKKEEKEGGKGEEGEEGDDAAAEG
jgi:zinc protease